MFLSPQSIANAVFKDFVRIKKLLCTSVDCAFCDIFFPSKLFCYYLQPRIKDIAVGRATQCWIGIYLIIMQASSKTLLCNHRHIGQCTAQ